MFWDIFKYFVQFELTKAHKDAADLAAKAIAAAKAVEAEQGWKILCFKCCAKAKQQWKTMRCCLLGRIFCSLMISSSASSIFFVWLKTLKRVSPIVLGAAVSEIARLLVPTKCSCPSKPHRHNRMLSNSGPRLVPIWKVSLRRFKANAVSTPLKSASGAIVGSVVRGKGLHIRTCNLCCTRPVIMSNVGSVECVKCVEFSALLPWRSCGTALSVSLGKWKRRKGWMTLFDTVVTPGTVSPARTNRFFIQNLVRLDADHDKTGSPWALGFEIFQRGAYATPSFLNSL